MDMFDILIQAQGIFLNDGRPIMEVIESIGRPDDYRNAWIWTIKFKNGSCIDVMDSCYEGMPFYAALYGGRARKMPNFVNFLRRSSDDTGQLRRAFEYTAKIYQED